MVCTFEIRIEGEEPEDVDVCAGMVFGTGAESSYRLSDEAASPSHFSIVDLEGDLVIEDLGSRWGTSLAGGRILMKGQREPIRQNLVLLETYN